jgi:hypothetical protein
VATGELEKAQGEIRLEASGEYRKGEEALAASVEGVLDLSINVRYLVTRSAH